MASLLLKCEHNDSFVWSEDHFQHYVRHNFYCPDCRKGWSISVGSIKDPTYTSKPFNITHFKEPKKLREPFIIRMEGKRVFICHFVGEGGELCPYFYNKTLCSDEDMWRRCK